jgi:hypothetical protein
MDEKDEDLPLHAEAQAREKWRGGETLIKKGAEDTGLPASEVDNAAIGGSSGQDPVDGRPGKGGPGTIPPPD